MRLKFDNPKLKSPHGFYEYSDNDEHNVHYLRGLRYNLSDVARMLNLPRYDRVAGFFYDVTSTGGKYKENYSHIPPELEAELARVKAFAYQEALAVENAAIREEKRLARKRRAGWV